MLRYLYALTLSLSLSPKPAVLVVLLVASVFFSIMAGVLAIHYATRKTHRGSR